MTKITVKCPAKINLFLNIIGTKDKMHLLNMVNNTINLHDYLEIEMIEDDLSQINLTCTNPIIPCDSKNSVYKALQLMMNTYGITSSFNIRIVKQIPLEAGLGGESTDAAGLIHGINYLCNLNLSLEELCSLGIKIGSDIPFCLSGGSKKVTGTGEQIEEYPIPYNNFVIIKPDYSMSTKEAFKRYDELIKEYEILQDIQLGHNDFERIMPEILYLKEELYKLGAVFANLTGSGTALVGTFRDEEQQEIAYNHFKDKILTFKAKSCNGITINPKD